MKTEITEIAERLEILEARVNQLEDLLKVVVRAMDLMLPLESHIGKSFRSTIAERSDFLE